MGSMGLPKDDQDPHHAAGPGLHQQGSTQRQIQAVALHVVADKHLISAQRTKAARSPGW
jgi:predicted HD phosphohydrolase